MPELNSIVTVYVDTLGACADFSMSLSVLQPDGRFGGCDKAGRELVQGSSRIIIWLVQG